MANSMWQRVGRSPQVSPFRYLLTVVGLILASRAMSPPGPIAAGFVEPLGYRLSEESFRGGIVHQGAVRPDTPGREAQSAAPIPV